MKKTILFTLFMTILSINSQTTHTVNAGSFYYTPNQLTISQGDIVEWVNDGGLHDVNGNINSITGLSFGNPESFLHHQPVLLEQLYTPISLISLGIPL